jgi:hypothetical protein
MANTKFLNLDEFGEGEVLTIVLNGKEHRLQEMTVSDFIWAQKEMKRQESISDEVAVFESLVTMLSRQFPTVEKRELEALPMNKLRKLMDFVNSMAQQGAESAVAAANQENPPTAEQTA